jgi:hypothetical protein
MRWDGAITAGIYDRRNGVGASFCVATKLKIECPLYPQKQTLELNHAMSALAKSGLMHCLSYVAEVD